jgi:hypothetical protein
MVVNGDASSLTPHGALKAIASTLAPTRKPRPPPVLHDIPRYKLNTRFTILTV